FWQPVAENQFAAAAAARTAARGHRDKFLAAHHVQRRRRKHAGARVELPENLTRLRVERVEIAGGVAAAPGEDDVARGDDRSRLSPAVEDLLPDAVARRRIERGKISLRRTARSGRTV